MNLSPLAIQKFFDNNGRPLVGGQVFTYEAGTTTKLATYQDEAGTPNTNPIILDFRGECRLWIDPTLTYKFVLAPRDDADPPTNPIWSVDDITAIGTSQTIGQILWPQSAAELAAGITPTNYNFFYGYAPRYGTGLASLQSALLQAAETGGLPAKAAPIDYTIGANTIEVPDEVVFDITSASITSANATVITLGNGSALYAQDATIVGSGNSGAAIAYTDPSVPGPMYIYGWPEITATNTAVSGSIGVDFTGSNKGIFEINVAEKFLINVTGGAGSPTPQTYYNEFRSPRLRTCTGGTAFRTQEGCNSTTVLNCQVSGGASGAVGVGGLYGFDIDSSGSLSILGGYVEAFQANNATRGCRITDSTNVSVIGVTFDQITPDATTSQALEIAGTSTQINLYGNGFGGGWGTSTKIMVKSGAGLYNFIGGAPTNQICLIGLSTWAGSYLNGYTQVGDVVGQHLTMTASEGAGFTHQLINSSTGQGLLLQTAATSAVAGRSVLTINRTGGAGFAINFQNNGTECGGISWGAGSPEGVVTAAVGNLYTNTSGGAGTTLYVKESGTGNTGWVAK